MPQRRLGVWRRLFTGLSVLLGIAGFCTIPFLVGIHDLLWTIGQIGWTFFVLYTVNAACTLLIPALGWWILMQAEGIPVSLSHAIQANLMGFPLNVATPSMLLGGEPLKVFYIATVAQGNGSTPSPSSPALSACLRQR